jgi:hypothetical protein
MTNNPIKRQMMNGSVPTERWISPFLNIGGGKGENKSSKKRRGIYLYFSLTFWIKLFFFVR